MFFTFPNARATLQWYLWGFDPAERSWARTIPAEEFVFYYGGVGAALVLYVWADTTLLARYHAAHPPGPGIRPRWSGLLPGLCLIAAATLAKVLAFPGHGWFPGYFAYIVAFGLMVPCVLYQAVRDTINWPALALSALVMVILSMLWEVTLSAAYGWWGFQSTALIGLRITAWNGLPVEEPCLWLLVSFNVVVVHATVASVLSRSGPRGGTRVAPGPPRGKPNAPVCPDSPLERGR